MSKILNSSQPIDSISTKGPDLTDMLKTAGWVPNAEKRRMEYKRAGDGFVMDHRAMTPREIERFVTGENMAKGINIEELIGEKWNHLKLIAVADPDPVSRAKRGKFKCLLCGEHVIKILSNVRAGLVKSCGCKRNNPATKTQPENTPPQQLTGQSSPSTALVPAARAIEDKPEKTIKDSPAELIEEQSAETVAEEPGQSSVVQVLPRFERDILKTGSRISAIIDYAELVAVEDVEELLSEITRVESSPFARVPEGAREQAAAFLNFKKTLESIRV
jgi:hypothetical protein